MSREIAKLFAAAAVLAAVEAGAASSENPPDDTPHVEWPAGGPRVVFIPQRSVPMFSCTVFAPAGSVLETPATNGAAHYLEHLLFNGTKTRTREQIYARTDLLGAYNNASTQAERTVFQLLLPSEKWREGLELQADMLLHSTIPADMFEKEKGIILEELAKDRSNPEYEAALFEGKTIWGENARALPVLGTEASIASMPRDSVVAFYRLRYRAPGMTMVVMGDFDVAEARAEITKLYAGAPVEVAPMPLRPDFPSGRALVAKPIQGLGGTRLRVMLPGPALDGIGFAGAGFLGSLLTSGEKSAVRRAVEAVGASPLDASATVDGATSWSMLTVSVDLPPDVHDVKPIVEAVVAHLTSMAARGADVADRDAARRELLADDLSLREKMHYFGLIRAEVLAVDPDAALHRTDDLEGAEKAALALLQGIVADGRVLATVCGDGVTDGITSLGPPPGIAAAYWLDGGKHGNVPPLPPAPPAATLSETRRVVLPNGLVVVAHSSPDARTFAAHVLLKDRARHEAALDLPRGAADVVHRMMGERTRKRDADELRGLLAAYGASLKVTDADNLPYDDYYFSPEYSYVRLESIDLFGLTALELLAEILYEPDESPEGFAKALAAAATRAEKEAGTARLVAEAGFYGALGDGHPLGSGVYGPADELKRLDLDGARRLHDALVAPGNVVLTISSSLPADLVLEAARRDFGDRTTSASALPQVAWRAKGAPARVETPTGREQSWIVVGVPLDVAAKEQPAVRLAVSILSERLAEQLREKEGLAYSIGASARLGSAGACLTMEAGTRAQNLERMEKGMLEVAATLTSAPPNDAEVEGARNRGEGRERMRRLSRIGIAYAMAMTELRGGDPTKLDAELPALRAVTSKDVGRCAKKYLTFGDPVIAVAR